MEFEQLEPALWRFMFGLSIATLTYFKDQPIPFYLVGLLMAFGAYLGWED